MNVDDLVGITYGTAILLFAISWKYNPLNPDFVYYSGMRMSKEQIATYIITALILAGLAFLWIWVLTQ